MYDGMMDPEMLKLAQEQMSRLRPEDLQRMQQQMMSNPELIRMATEGMKNMKAEDLRFAAEQMKNLPPEQIADLSSRIGRASPEEIEAMRIRTEAQQSYEYQGALSLKAQGNHLHGIGKFTEAAEKYCRAKNNLTGLITKEAKNLRLTCSLNLMSCYLKLSQYDDAVAEGTQVLKDNTNNLKALYRRGQAYKELRKLKLAVKDLRKAAEISPEDETIADVLRQACEELKDEESDEKLSTSGPIIEEISEEEEERLSGSSGDDVSSNRHSLRESTNDESSQQQGTIDQPTTSFVGRSIPSSGHPVDASLNTLTKNPEMIRTMHTMMSSVSPEHIAALSGGGMTADMAKMAADMVKKMSPDDFERMVGMANQLRPQDTGSRTANAAGTAMQSSNLRAGYAPASTSSSHGLQAGLGNSLDLEQRLSGSNSGESTPSMPDFSPEMQGHLRQQMKDPNMKQMMASMMKSITPEAMASMSEQMGIKLSPEDAAQAQQAMANLSPDDLDRLMWWAQRAQDVTDRARRAKKWVLGQPGLILAVVMLMLAVTLHWLGYIGS